MIPKYQPGRFDRSQKMLDGLHDRIGRSVITANTTSTMPSQLPGFDIDKMQRCIERAMQAAANGPNEIVVLPEDMILLPTSTLRKIFGDRCIFISEDQACQLMNECRNSLSLYPERVSANITYGSLTSFGGLPIRWVDREQRKLKPCPFCGSHDVKLHPCADYYAVRCKDCMVEGPSADRLSDNPEQEAIDLWNTRVGREKQPT